MEDICKHKDCSCENVGLGDCVKLQELNDLQIRPKMRAILKAEWCNLPEAIRRAFYGVWCVLKNIINRASLSIIYSLLHFYTICQQYYI